MIAVRTLTDTAASLRYMSVRLNKAGHQPKLREASVTKNKKPNASNMNAISEWSCGELSGIKQHLTDTKVRTLSVVTATVDTVSANSLKSST